MNSRVQPLLSGTCTFIVSAVLALPLLCSTAHAVTIAIPPEAVDSNGDVANWSFSELNGTALAGQALSLSFVFAQPLLVHDLVLDDGVNSYFSFALAFVHGTALTFEGLTLPSGFMFDDNGPLPPLTLGRFANGHNIDHPGIVFYAFLFGPDELLDGILISGVHMLLELPNTEGSAHIESATLSIVNPSGRVQIAEPGTLALFSLGLLGLGVVRRRAA